VEKERLMKSENIKSKAWKILEADKPNYRLGYKLDIFILGLISINVIAVVLETIPSLSRNYANLFLYLEWFSVIVFSIEYLARLWSCSSSPKYKKPYLGRVKYIFSPMAIIDLLAILPFYLTFIQADLRVHRALRLARIFRIFKVGRYSEALKLL
jgi:voltage-gated potassium channel